ncbi:hypothetical protein HYR69_04120 [Candidatus Sumerlaeota bacterium]|nr:hypothetical protein [Candidatus Sumerlaeota bacterium]
MIATTPKPHRILAIDPSTKGFGFVVLEAPEKLVDWGIKEAQGNKNAHCRRQISFLVDFYQPDLIVLEDITHGSRRCDRVRELILEIHEFGREHNLQTRSVSKADLRKTFESTGATTKDDIAKVLAERFPELALRLPVPRRPWDGQNPNMAIFGAVGMAVAVSKKDYLMT